MSSGSGIYWLTKLAGSKNPLRGFSICVVNSPNWVCQLLDFFALSSLGGENIHLIFVL